MNNNHTQTILTALRPLTDDERLDAREAAQRFVLRANGDKPRRDQFNDVAVSRYPGWFTRIVAGFMLVVFIAAAMPSLFRLYTAGSEYFLHGIDNQFLASIVGVSTFLLAEFLIILSTISARVYFEGRQRWIFVIPVLLGLAMALVGNWVVAQPSDLFGWLETLSPPLAVLFLALIGERLTLDSIETRHANERAYQQAVADWSKIGSNPEASHLWKSAYANALKSVIRDVNAKGRGMTERVELMNSMTSSHWRPVIIRELQAERWADDLDASAEQGQVQQVVTTANPTMQPVPVAITSSGNGNGNH